MNNDGLGIKTRITTISKQTYTHTHTNFKFHTHISLHPANVSPCRKTHKKSFSLSWPACAVPCLAFQSNVSRVWICLSKAVNWLFLLFSDSHVQNYGIIALAMVIKNVNIWTIGLSIRCVMIYSRKWWIGSIIVSLILLYKGTSESSFRSPSCQYFSPRSLSLSPAAVLVNYDFYSKQPIAYFRNVHTNSYLIDWNDFQWNSYFLTTMSYK